MAWAAGVWVLLFHSTLPGGKEVAPLISQEYAHLKITLDHPRMRSLWHPWPWFSLSWVGTKVLAG